VGNSLDLFERHRWAASLRVIAIRGQIERHHDIRLRHLELGEAAATEEIAARIQALEQELIFAEAIKAAVEARARRRPHRGRGGAEIHRA
jgi:hypothetical protein